MPSTKMRRTKRQARGNNLDPAREAILDSALEHVPFDGWSRTSLLRGAEDAGYDESMARRAFPRGASELVAFHSSRGDERMLGALERMDLASMKVRERVATAVRTRLRQDAEHKEAVRLALAYLAQPHHSGLGLRCLYRTVDAIWYACGDTATDFNFYTKRALLAGVYSTTVLYWINDRTPYDEATWGFLDRRIGDVMNISMLTGRLRWAACHLPDPFRIVRAFAGRR
jgi:ubiquinone biosynthesis protein COQ9